MAGTICGYERGIKWMVVRCPNKNSCLGSEQPVQIFTTKKYWILFRIGPERRRKGGMPTGVYY
nr:Ycf15 [Schnabelia oligophylla]QVL26679.1 Ycf15 [Schnabelia oligophylla]